MRSWKLYQTASVVAVGAAFFVLIHNAWVYGTLDPPRDNLLVSVYHSVSRHLPKTMWAHVSSDAQGCSDRVEDFWKQHDVVLTWSHPDTRHHPLVVRARRPGGVPMCAVAIDSGDLFGSP